MTTFENISVAQKHRAALHRDVRAICSETCHLLGLEVTRSAIEVIAELVYKKIAVYGADLEAFAKHAKRTTINSEDVKLLVRRNTSLKAYLNKIGPNAPKEKRKKTGTPVAKQPETPKTKTDETLKSTEVTKEEKQKENDFEDKLLDDMVVDEMIDLTFE